MVMAQPGLFRLPVPRRIEVTREQLALLDLVALQDGAPFGDLLPIWSRPVLRRVLAAGLVKCVALGPAIYLLTPIGRVVRGRNR